MPLSESQNLGFYKLLGRLKTIKYRISDVQISNLFPLLFLKAGITDNVADSVMIVLDPLRRNEDR